MIKHDHVVDHVHLILTHEMRTHCLSWANLQFRFKFSTKAVQKAVVKPECCVAGYDIDNLWDKRTTSTPSSQSIALPSAYRSHQQQTQHEQRSIL
jgi:hypothetical protein